MPQFGRVCSSMGECAPAWEGRPSVGGCATVWKGALLEMWGDNHTKIGVN